MECSVLLLAAYGLIFKELRIFLYFCLIIKIPHTHKKQQPVKIKCKIKQKTFLKCHFIQKEVPSSIHYHIQTFCSYLSSLFSQLYVTIMRYIMKDDHFKYIQFVPKPKLPCKPYLEKTPTLNKVRIGEMSMAFKAKPKQANINPYFKHFSVVMMELLCDDATGDTHEFLKRCVCVSTSYILRVYGKKSVKSSVFCIYLFTLNFTFYYFVYLLFVLFCPILSHVIVVLDTVKLP